MESGGKTQVSVKENSSGVLEVTDHRFLSQISRSPKRISDCLDSESGWKMELVKNLRWVCRVCAVNMKEKFSELASVHIFGPAQVHYKMKKYFGIDVSNVAKMLSWHLVWFLLHGQRRSRSVVKSGRGKPVLRLVSALESAATTIDFGAPLVELSCSRRLASVGPHAHICVC